MYFRSVRGHKVVPWAGFEPAVIGCPIPLPLGTSISSPNSLPFAYISTNGELLGFTFWDARHKDGAPYGI